MKNKSVEICVYILAESEAAFKVCEDEEMPQSFVWVPKSQMEMADGDFVEHYGTGDTIECSLPIWIATQKGLI